jgi:ribonuclease P protein subunit RPR2
MPKNARRRVKEEQKKIAMERAGMLFDLADDSALSGDVEKAHRYIESARNIAMRYNLRIPKRYKRRFCKYCYAYLLPSVTSNVRIDPREHRVEVKCLKCGRTMLYPFIKELKERRKDERKSKDVTHREKRGNRKSPR